jgi:PAS domain S-box-containing protein
MEVGTEMTMVSPSGGPADSIRPSGTAGSDMRRPAAMSRLMAEAEELAQIGSWALDLETGEGVWSEGMYRIHGLAPGAFEPGVETFLDRTHPEDREPLAALLALVQDDPAQVPEEGLTAEYRAIRADGSVRDVRFHGRLERDEAGAPVRWSGVAQDVTDQRLTERELQAHYAVSQALREWESFDEGVVGLLRRLATALDVPVAAMWVPGEDGRLEARAFWSAPGVDASSFEAVSREVSFREGEGPLGRMLQTGQPVVAADLAEVLFGSRRRAAMRSGLRSGLAFAATGDDGALAILCFYTHDRRAPSERLLRTLTGLGRELGRFLAGRRAELGSRRLSERELEVLSLAAEGNSGPQIAERLVVSPATVKTHFEHIYEKLGVGDRAAAVAHALRTGLIR